MKGSLFNISPYMQEQMVRIGQELVYESGSELLGHLLGVEVGASQLFRVCDTYGAMADIDLVTQSAQVELSAADELYVQADGTMILTEQGYREVKVGRTFRSSDCKEKAHSGDRGQVQRSDYVAHLGDSRSFIQRMTPRLAPYKKQEQQLIFLTDGAKWIDQWIERDFPQAVRILDFYHVLEHLGKCAEGCWEQAAQRKKWLEDQRQCLFKQGGSGVLQTLKALAATKGQGLQVLQKTIQYFENNLHRMNYPTYLANQWFIGSGAVESAHRSLVHHRMKKAGQRWSVSGANHMLNLRVCTHADRWDIILNDILLMNNCRQQAA